MYALPPSPRQTPELKRGHESLNPWVTWVSKRTDKGSLGENGSSTIPSSMVRQCFLRVPVTIADASRNSMLVA